MPVDGTSGRFSAHNQRFKELRRKKLERREEKLLQNSLKNSGQPKPSTKEPIDPTKLAELKVEIKKKAQKQLLKEFYLVLLSIVLVVLFYYLFLS
ncbi:hypothetical protein [Leeuwenhoekiella nanhaiensis]|uniref:Uncharacterized protein n=1 Tax=Leeuwenhoekiella nanhaiensis TaxID=1655491 RepID=A0A2G1VMN0_9FLAO|nr:hypothetical protein [Leeuwenhoekiella nanhaiensis]PHQ27994.1 hypothetical protein CJ305_16940 [Leeuwenhoekiella nanhaiensis]